MHSGILAAKQATAVYRAVNAEGVGGTGSCPSPHFWQTSNNPTLTRGTDCAQHVISSSWPLDFQTFLRPCIIGSLDIHLRQAT